jgi:hypothetical protein
VVDGLAGLSLCVCVYVFVHISNMDLPLWARKCSECLVLGNRNYFVLNAKGPSVVDGYAGLSLCVCVYLTWTCC